MAQCASRRWQVLLLVLLLGAPAASASRAGSATRSSTASNRRATFKTAVARVGKTRRQQPPLEDPEALLAERDDLRAQVATKNSEFLAQHRRADQLLLKVRDLEIRLRSEGHLLRTSQQRLQAEEIKDEKLETTLEKVRAALADATNSAVVGKIAPNTPDSEERTVHTSSPVQHDRPSLEIRAPRQDRKASPDAVHMHIRAPPRAASLKSSAIPAAAAGAHASTVSSTGPLNTVRLKRVASPEIHRPSAHADSHQDAHKQDLSEPTINRKVPQAHDKEEGGPNTFSELERQLQEEDSKIAKLDKIDQEEDSTVQQRPLAVSALVLDTSLTDVSAGDAELHPRAVEHLSGRDSDSELDPASEADAALLASMTKH